MRAQLEDFAAVVFAGLPRSDQRATGLRYLRGLMLDGRRKSMQPMAERLGVDHQQLQQFLTSSTWDVTGVRRRLTAAAVELVDPQVWVVDDTGFPRDGKASACVARQYSGTVGKVGNCQIAVSVHAATSGASAVLDWRLFVPESWEETCVGDDEGAVANIHAHRLRHSPYTLDEAGAKKPRVRRRRTGPEQAALIRSRRVASKLPDTERYRPKWLMALEMLDELGAAEFRLGLTERGIGYVVATTATTTAQPGDAAPVPVPYAGVGKYPQPRYPDPARAVKDVALTHVHNGAGTTQLVRWRHRLPGSLQPTGDPDRPSDELAGHFPRPAGAPGRPRDPAQRPARPRRRPARVLAAGRMAARRRRTHRLLAVRPIPDTPLPELVHLAKSRWRIEHDYRELKQALGLDHFEGRSWIGWHRHVTLAAAAQLFLTQLRLENPKAQGQD